MRRLLCVLPLILAVALSSAAAEEKKGEFTLFLNGVNKGYEKFKVRTDAKQNLLTISSEVRFQLPVAKAKRGYVDLFVYPILDLALDSRAMQGYSYRLTFNDFTNMDLVEAQGSATEVVDQDFRNYNLFNRSAQIQEDEMANRIDLGVNAGSCMPSGSTLHFQQMRFSNNRVKDEPLPADLVVLDSYTFSPFLALAPRAFDMKSDIETFTVAMPQGLKLKPCKLLYLGTEKTPFHGKTVILRHYDVVVGDSPYASFWMDKTRTLVQVVLPSEGILAVLKKYDPKPFEREEPRLPKSTVEVKGSFTEKAVQVSSSGVSLAATLTLPIGSGPFPSILLVQDLIQQDRDGNEPSNPYSRSGTWKQLAYCFADAGYATLRFDPRGVGESGGSADKVLPSERVQDVAALAAWLRDQPSTKGKKVILAASGLGAWVAAKAADPQGTAGLVAYSYPAKSLLRLWKEQVGTMGDPQARQQAYVDLDALGDKMKTTSAEEWVTFRGQKLYLPGLREIATWDPLALAASVKGPCLFAYPDKDQTVLGFHRDVLSPSLRPDQTTLMLTGVSHRLTRSEDENAPSGLVDCKVLAPIVEWLGHLEKGG